MSLKELGRWCRNRKKMVAKESKESRFCLFVFCFNQKQTKACAFVKLRERSLVKMTNEQVIKGAEYQRERNR